MSNNLLRNVDEYFPKLNKLIEKGKTDEAKTVIADDPQPALLQKKTDANLKNNA
jgi:hypothetical protein